MRTHLHRSAGSRVLVGAVMVGLVLGASACGGGKKPSAASVQWASGACSAFTTLKNSLKHVKSSLTGGIPTSSELKQAGSQAKDATTTLAQSLKKLGAPGTTDGKQAKSDIEALETSISGSTSAIEAILQSKPASVADAAGILYTVQTEVTAMAGDINMTVASLKQLDPGGELEKAFDDAPACSAYVGR